jgi:hypothetical protein
LRRQRTAASAGAGAQADLHHPPQPLVYTGSLVAPPSSPTPPVPPLLCSSHPQPGPLPRFTRCRSCVYTRAGASCGPQSWCGSQARLSQGLRGGCAIRQRRREGPNLLPQLPGRPVAMVGVECPRGKMRFVSHEVMSRQSSCGYDQSDAAPLFRGCAANACGRGRPRLRSRVRAVRRGSAPSNRRAPTPEAGF